MTMSLSSALLTSLVAFGSQWPIIDLPYPDIDRIGGGISVPSVETQVEDAVARYARSREPRALPQRRPEISQLRIDGARASAIVTTGERTELLQLELVEREWRVIRNPR